MAKLKQNKWYNFGDVNPREHGGRFVRRIGDSIEVVITHCHASPGYWMQYNEYEVKELIEEYKKWNDDSTQGPGSYSDWTVYKGMDIDDLMYYLAIDMLGYYGGPEDDQIEIETNYWKELKSYGIHRSIIMGRTKKVG